MHRWWNACSECVCSLRGPPLAAAEALHTALADFRKHVPLIEALREPGMRERHWRQLEQSTGIRLHMDAGLSLAAAVAQKLPRHSEAVCALAHTAARERALDNMLDDMQVRLACCCNTLFRFAFTLPLSEMQSQLLQVKRASCTANVRFDWPMQSAATRLQHVVSANVSACRLTGAA